MFRVPRAFWLGFLSAFQLLPTQRPYIPPLPKKSDAEAIRDDWEAVGGYLYAAMGQALPKDESEQ